MKCIDCKLVRNTIIFGVITLVTVVLSYNFLDIKVANIVHTSDLFGTGVSTIADLISKIFSPKIWTVITALAVLISGIIYLRTKKNIKQILYNVSRFSSNDTLHHYHKSSTCKISPRDAFIRR